MVYMNATSPMWSEPKGTRIRFVNRTDNINATVIMNSDRPMQLLNAIANIRARSDIKPIIFMKSSSAASPLKRRIIFSIVVALVIL